MISALRALLCLAILLLGCTAHAQEDNPPPPWEGAEPKPVTQQNQTIGLSSPKHLQRYSRYQRAATIGVPFYLGGLSLAGWASYQTFALNNQSLGVGVSLVAGAIVSVGGAGAIAWGSHSAAMALFDDDPRGRDIVAGRIAFGMLGGGSTAMLAGLYIGSVVNAEGALVLVAGGAGAAVGAGIPGLIQMAKNTKMRKAQLAALPTVLPRKGGVSFGVVGRF